MATKDQKSAGSAFFRSYAWVIGVGLILLIAYGLVPGDQNVVSNWSVVLFVVGILLLSALTIGMTVREFTGSSQLSPRLRLFALLWIIVGSIAFFATSYYRLSQIPNEISGMNTQLDAIYFTVSTSLTVGFGDIFASSQIARFEVLIQMLYTVIILATAAKLMAVLLRHGVEKRGPRVVRRSSEPAAPPE